MSDSSTQCAQWAKSKMAEIGVEVTVSTLPPLVQGPYPTEALRCPHGTTYYLEPTGEQIAEWVRTGER